MSEAGDIAELLEERPDLESAADAILAVDDDRDTWAFDDVPADSGAFGELVSQGVVERAGDEYQVADPGALRAALDGSVPAEADTGTATPDVTDISLPTVERRPLAFLAGALAVVFAARAYVVGSIYRGGDIVLSGNDPYYYRYWVERIAADAGGNFDLNALSVLPDAVTSGEPLMVATLWWFAELFGGGTTAIGHVLAWYPVVSAVISGVLVYFIAVRVTRDRRIGLASLLFLAFIPGHTFRTSLGYADHHAFDYPWLALTALALVAVLALPRETDPLKQPSTWLASGGLGVGIAGQVLSWEAGPLLILPVGIAVAATTLLDSYNGRFSPRNYVPVAVGTATGALLVWLVHTAAAWHTTLVAAAPALLVAGVVGVVLTALLADRVGGTARQLAAVDAGIAIAGLAVLRGAFPEQWAEFLRRSDLLFRTDAIAETAGLFNFESFGFLFLLGFTLPLALPAMAWAVRLATTGRTDWLVAATYGWYFLLLASIQIRFVGGFASFAALFAGYGFVHLAAYIDAARPISDSGIESITDVSIPEKQTLGVLFALFLLVGSFGILQVPVKTSQVLIDDGAYDTAGAIEDDAVERGLEYPDNYVLSNWGRNRVYNYFVNGESQSYGYARANYEEFATSTDPNGWYNRLNGRAGYVVTTDGPDLDAEESVYSRLHDSYGSRNGEIDGSGHYRPIFASDDGGHKAFALVPGATIEGSAPSNATVTVSTELSVSDEGIIYERQTTANESGMFVIRVANPGTYDVTIDGESREVVVPEGAVSKGQRVAVDSANSG